MNSHLNGLLAEMVTAGCHEPQFAYTEIGAEPGHASNVQRAGRLDQHNDGIQGSGSAECAQVGQEVGHRLRLHLKTRHGWCFAADDLVNQGWVFQQIADALQ